MTAGINQTSDTSAAMGGNTIAMKTYAATAAMGTNTSMASMYPIIFPSVASDPWQ